MIKEDLKEIIYEVRDKNVIFIRDLALIYKCKNGTKEINQAIKRNIDKFSNDDYFQLTDEEFVSWKSQFVTAKEKFSKIRTLPFVITKDGIKVLMTILKSKNVLEISNDIINSMLEKERENINELTSQELIKNTDFSRNNQGKIENLIYEVRGFQVMLDSDLSILYGCKNGTKDINKAVKRNIERFPNDFYFQLTDEESKTICSRFQFGTLNESKIIRGHNIKYNPYVFTEEGVSMLASVLRTKNASIISVNIMRAFVKMRHFIRENQILMENVLNLTNKVDKKFIEYDSKFEILFSKFENKEYKELLFFNGQIFDAYSKILDIINFAKIELIIIDSYLDKTILEMISNLKIKVILITKQNQNLKEKDIEKYNEQYNNLKVIYNDTYHDRYFIIDKKEIYHCGASLNHAGKRTFGINKLEDNKIIESLLNEIYNLIES